MDFIAHGTDLAIRPPGKSLLCLLSVIEHVFGIYMTIHAWLRPSSPMAEYYASVKADNLGQSKAGDDQFYREPLHADNHYWSDG